MKRSLLIKSISGAALACACVWTAPQAKADWWVGPDFGDWSVPANWSGGIVPTTVGEVTNATAVISSVVPAVVEAWAGNSGVAGNIIITNGGDLTVNNWAVVSRNGNGGNTPLSTMTIAGNGILRKKGDGFIVGDTLNGKGILTVKDNAQVLVTGGYNQFGLGWDRDGGHGEAWVYLQDNAVFTTPGYDFNVSDWGNGRGHVYIKDNAVLNVSRFWVGKWDSTIGALWQDGGTVNGTGSAANEWCIGGEGSGASEASYGFYQMTAGNLICPFNFQVGRYGKGLLYQFGGTNTQSGWCDTGRYSQGTGVTWLTGGLLQHIGTGTHYIVAENGRGEVTVSGTGVLDTFLNLYMGNGPGYLNLKGGTVAVPGFEKWNGGNGYLNFNGGTLQAKSTNPNFLPTAANLAAYIYPGGATFDTAGHDITVSLALLDIYGQGVQSIPVSSGGSGYVGAPIVQLTGDGQGTATAVAQIDRASGSVTNVVVTNPGFGFSTAPTITLIGGGAATEATLGTPVLANLTPGTVTKIGLGTLTLAGQNTYTGVTRVNEGALIVTTDNMASGGFVVANGAELGVRVAMAYGQTLAGSATFGTSTLSFDLSGLGNPLIPPFNVTGALTANGTVTVNISSGLPQVGQFSLLQYGSQAGAGNFVLGTLPLGVQAELINNTANKTLDLKITSVAQPRWDGAVAGTPNGTWDINSTQNWVEMSTGLPTTYNDGLPAVFNDDATGTTDVTLNTTVRPASVTVTNVNLAYSFTGTGKITGAGGLTKQGTNSLVMNLQNDYTGVTRLAGGALIVTNLTDGGLASGIGAASGDPTNLVFSGGTLSYAGPATTFKRGYTLESGMNTLDNQSDVVLTGQSKPTGPSGFAKSGAGKLTYTRAGVNELSGGGTYPGYNVLGGTLVFDGTAGQTNHVQGEMWAASSPTATASLILTNTTLNIDSWFALGRGNGTVGNASSATLWNSSLNSGSASMGYDNGIGGNLASQLLTLNGTSTFTNGGDMNLGESTGSSATVVLKDNTILYSGGRIHLGWHNSATGMVTMANSALMRINAWFSLGNEGGTGSMVMKDNSVLSILWDLNVTDVGLGLASFAMQDNATVTAGAVFVAKGEGSTGTFDMIGNAQVTSGNFYVASATNSTGTVTLTSGSIRTTGGGGNEFQIGVRGLGTFNQTGGTVSSDANWTSIGRLPSGTGILNLSGGVFSHTSPTRFPQVGEEGAGTLNVSGTGRFDCAAADALQIGSAASAVGEVNLNGGTIVARRVRSGAGQSTFNFNGGTLLAAPNANVDFMSGIGIVNVNAGGAVIDTGTNIVGILQPLAGAGGLTKLGTGTLALNGANTYTGPTTVSAGALGGNGTIASAVTVASGATLAPGTSVGVLTVNNTLTLASGSTTVMELDVTAGTNDLVQGVSTLTYGGTLMIKNLAGALTVGQSFQLFKATTYSGSFTSVQASSPGQTVTFDTSRLAIDGTVKVATVAGAEASIVSSIADGNLTLSWPEGQGWRLEGQTNSLAVGISNNWVTVAGSTTTNKVIIPINTNNGASFFRLVNP